MCVCMWVQTCLVTKNIVYQGLSTSTFCVLFYEQNSLAIHLRQLYYTLQGLRVRRPWLKCAISPSTVVG